MCTEFYLIKLIYQAEQHQMSMRIYSLLTALMFTYEVFFSVIKKIQTEIDLLENMLMQIELDDDATFKDFLCRTSVKDFSFCQKKGGDYTLFVFLVP